MRINNSDGTITASNQKIYTEKNKGEISVSTEKMHDAGNDMRALSQTIRNRSFNIELTNSSGAAAEELLTAIRYIKDIASALIELTDVTATLIDNAAFKYEASDTRSANNIKG